MLTEYMQAAMRHAEYEDLGMEGWFGHIVGMQDPWANAVTLEETKHELRGVLEDWLLLSLRLGDSLPVLEGIDLNVPPAPVGAEECRPSPRFTGRI